MTASAYPLGGSWAPDVEMVDEGFDIGIRESWEAAIADVRPGAQALCNPGWRLGAQIWRPTGYVGFAEEVLAQEKQLGF